MKSLVLRLVLVMMALMAFDVVVPESDQISKSHVLSQIPVLDIDPLRDPTSRISENKLNYIADPFIPMVVLADSLYEERDISFYLPRYELHFQQDFFLRI